MSLHATHDRVPFMTVSHCVRSCRAANAVVVPVKYDINDPKCQVLPQQQNGTFTGTGRRLAQVDNSTTLSPAPVPGSPDASGSASPSPAPVPVSPDAGSSPSLSPAPVLDSPPLSPLPVNLTTTVTNDTATAAGGFASARVALCPGFRHALSVH